MKAMSENIDVCRVSDESYDGFAASWAAARKKSNWHAAMVMSSGQHRKVQRDSEGFYLINGSNKQRIVTARMHADMLRDLRKTYRIEVNQEPIDNDDQLEAAVASNATGNHKGKSKKIAVPTPAGQPVRG